MDDFYAYRVAHSETIESIFKNGYVRGVAGDTEGVDYGVGVYLNISLRQSEHMCPSNYGDTIIKNKIVGGLDRFLIFDEKVANQVYGTTDLKSQVYYLFENDADDVWSDFKHVMRKYGCSERDGGQWVTKPSGIRVRRTAQIGQYMFGRWSDRHIIEKYARLCLSHNIAGMYYTGVKDGTSVVVYDFSKVVPVAYKYGAKGEWKTMKYGASHKVDSFRILGLNYKSVGNAVYLQDGRKFCTVKKKDGNMNMVDLDTKKEIIPFDVITQITPMSINGAFSFETVNNGEKVLLKANADGFFYEGEFYPFEEEEMGVNETKRLTKILSEALLTTFANDEAKTIYSSDVNKALSIYKVVKGEDVESIAHNGELNQFNSTHGNAYGRGVYSWVDLKDAQYTQQHEGSYYGNAIMEYRVKGGFDKFICFDPASKKRVYGNSHITIREQLRKCIGTHEGDKIANIIGEPDSRNVYSALSILSEKAMKYDIRGAIFLYYGGPRTVCLPFDFASCIPYKVSYDGGRTWKKVYDETVEKRFNRYVDTQWALGDRGYKKISDMISIEYQGKPREFAMVQKQDLTYNLVDLQTSDELIPLDGIKKMSPPSIRGFFKIEIAVGGEDRILKANLDGIWVDDEFIPYSELG